jgi:hypothetical protein
MVTNLAAFLAGPGEDGSGRRAVSSADFRRRGVVLGAGRASHAGIRVSVRSARESAGVGGSLGANEIDEVPEGDVDVLDVETPGGSEDGGDLERPRLV